MSGSPRDDHQQQVAALRHGTVVDHLNPGTAVRALEILGVPRDGAALLGMHLESAKMGRKDILKLSGVEIGPDEIAKIALFGPQATVSIIRDYRVASKVSVELPEQIVGILHCPNPSCITNHETVETRFHVGQQKPLLMRCHFCERRLHGDELAVI